MVSKLSMKKKIIIFVVISIIAIVAILLPAYKENEKNKALKVKVEMARKKEIKKQNERKKEEDKKIQEDKNKKADIEEKYQQGYNAFQVGKYKEAIELENHVIIQDDNNYKAYAIKGIGLCYLGKFQEGMKSIEISLNIKPDYGYGMFCKARSYEIYGRYSEALDCYDKAISLEDFVWSYYGKASVYGRMGDAANACKYLKIAIDKKPEVLEEAKKDVDFAEIRDKSEFKQLIIK